jgi:hypothetical protein
MPGRRGGEFAVERDMNLSGLDLDIARGGSAIPDWA